MTDVGDAEVLANLNREIGRMRGLTPGALKSGALQILRQSNKRVPVDTGNLRASGDVDAAEVSGQPVASVFYTANYAVHVHENMEANYRVGMAKFLQRAIPAARNQVVGVIRERLRVRR